MNPIGKVLLLILFLIVFSTFAWPFIHQVREMYKTTKQRWTEEEDETRELARLLEKIEEEKRSSSHTNIEDE